jgi:hypothetical protein
MGDGARIEQLEPAVIDAHDGRQRTHAAAPFDGQEHLLRGLVHRHVVNDDLVVGRAQQRGQLLIDPAHQVGALEVVKIAQLDAGLGDDVLGPQGKRVDGAGGDVAHEQHIARAEAHDAGGLERARHADGGRRAIGGQSSRRHRHSKCRRRYKAQQATTRLHQYFLIVFHCPSCRVVHLKPV